MAPIKEAKRNIAVFAEFPMIRSVGEFLLENINPEDYTPYDKEILSGAISGDTFKSSEFQNHLIDRLFMANEDEISGPYTTSHNAEEIKRMRKGIQTIIDRSFPSQALAIKSGYATGKGTFEPGLESETKGDIKVSVYAYYGDKGVKNMMTQVGSDLGGKNIETVVMGHSGSTYGDVFPEDWGKYTNILMDTANVVDMTLAACNAGDPTACDSAKILTGFSKSFGNVLAVGQRDEGEGAKWGSSAYKEGKKANWGYEDWMGASAADIFLNPYYNQYGFDVSTEEGTKAWNEYHYDLMRSKYDDKIAEELGALSGLYPYVTEGLSWMMGGLVGDIHAESEKHPDTGEPLYKNILDKWGLEWFKERN